MDTFEFSTQPAYVTVGDGMGMAATYLRKTWEWWIVPVVGFAIAGGLLTGLLTNTALDTNFRALSRGEQLGEITGLILPAAGLGIVLAILGVVATWFYAALAIHGLRGRPLTADWVIGAGVKSLLGSLLIGAVSVGLWIAVAILALATKGFALIALIGIVPGFMYVAIRIYFWTIAIFDGAGITEAFRVSWELSRGAVLRMLGWGVAFVVLGFTINLGVTIVRLPFSGLPAISTFISELVTGVYSVYTLYGAAVLYESQRWRNAPPASAQPPYPGYPGAPGPLGGYPGPTPQPGYPPMAYPGGGYSQPWGAPSTAPVPPVYAPAPDPFAPPARPAGGEVPPPPPAATGGSQPLVPWGPVPQQPTWNPPPTSGWVPAPQSGWAATPPPPTPAPPAPTPALEPAPAPDALAPEVHAPVAETDASPTIGPDDSPTEPYTPPTA